MRTCSSLWKWNRTATNIFVDHCNTYKREAVWFVSLIASWTTFRSDGIKFLFVAMMPVLRSRNLPLEKSKSFPTASVTMPPASVKGNNGKMWVNANLGTVVLGKEKEPQINLSRQLSLLHGPIFSLYNLCVESASKWHRRLGPEHHILLGCQF